MPDATIIEGDNLDVLRRLPDGCVDLAYIDPPFNTGSERRGGRHRSIVDDGAGYAGFGGRSYRREHHAGPGYDDSFDDYLAFLQPRLRELHRVLAGDGSLFVHVDPRESHYVKVWLDGLFGRQNFQNEVIWAYDYGGRSRRRWSPKHDVILWYTRDRRAYTYDFDAIDRVPYMAPGLVSPEKAARGKTPTDVWWNTIVPTQGRERTGYPTQKPLAILDRIVRVHSRAGDLVLDCFAGSGTTGEAALRNSRRALLVDESPAAVELMRGRLQQWQPVVAVASEFMLAPRQNAAT